MSKVDSCCRSCYLPEEINSNYWFITNYPGLAANQNPRSKRLKMKLALGVQILNQDGYLSMTGLFDKIYVFSLSTSQHEDALSHEYTNLSKLEHNSIVTPSHSQFKF